MFSYIIKEKLRSYRKLCFYYRTDSSAYALLSSMDRTKRSLVKAYIIAAQGIKLWNETGLAIKEQRRDSDLAVRLEYWYHSYKELWRECSKESELYRIGEVVFWYADLLRG